MQEYITPDRTANAIMQREDSFDTFLILEGSTDELLFRKFVDHERCKIEIGFGYQGVLEIQAILESRAFTKSLGIIDGDFRVLDNEQVMTQNVILTDFHDLEVSILNSDAFENVLTFHIQSHKLLGKYENFDGFRQHLFHVLRPLSFLKWLNKRRELGLIFKPRGQDGKSLDFSKFFCKDTLSFLGTNTLVKALLNFCSGKVAVGIKEDELRRELDDFINDEIDSNQLSNGHDIIVLMSLSLRKHVSNLDSKAIQPDQLARELSLAYETQYFQKTKLYKKIKRWEDDAVSAILTF